MKETLTILDRVSKESNSGAEMVTNALSGSSVDSLTTQIEMLMNNIEVEEAKLWSRKTDPRALAFSITRTFCSQVLMRIKNPKSCKSAMVKEKTFGKPLTVILIQKRKATGMDGDTIFTSSVTPTLEEVAHSIMSLTRNAGKMTNRARALLPDDCSSFPTYHLYYF